MNGNGTLVRIAAIACVAIVAACAFMVALPHGSGEDPVPDDPGTVQEPLPYTFEFVALDKKRTPAYEATMYYADAYFDSPGGFYNPSLATASCALAMTTGVVKNGMSWLCTEETLARLGFTYIEHNSDHEIPPETDTIGVVVGQKETGGCTLICVVIRGIGYGAEWGGNFDLGREGDHEGFDTASDKVLAYINTYAGKHGITDEAKLWITGYSRGSAVTNAVAGKICTAIAEGSGDGVSFGIASGGIYAYGFEVPCTVLPENHGSIHGSAYAGIWNIVNDADPVPGMVSSGFGLERYGTDVRLPSPSDQDYVWKKGGMLSFLNSLPSRQELGAYPIDGFRPFGGGEWTKQHALIADFNATFPEYFDRGYYMDTVEPGFRAVFQNLASFTDPLALLSAIESEAEANPVTFGIALAYIAAGDIPGAVELIRPNLVRAVVSAGAPEADAEELVTAAGGFLGIIGNFAKENIPMVATAAYNIRQVIYGHHTALTLSWLMSMDPNYAS